MLVLVEARVRPAVGPNWTVTLTEAHCESCSVTYARYITLLIVAVIIA
jgi:hypothetical protein